MMNKLLNTQPNQPLQTADLTSESEVENQMKQKHQTVKDTIATIRWAETKKQKDTKNWKMITMPRSENNPMNQR